MGAKKWTAEEIEYLKESWGNKSIATIAKKLNRSESAVLNKKHKLGLGAFLDSNSQGAITLYALLKTIGYSGSCKYKSVSWVEKRRLKTHRLKCGKQTHLVIYIHEFWKWAEKNQDFLDFSKFEKHALGAEPEWVDKKRVRDRIKAKNFKTTPWTKDEDERLLKYLKEYKYSWTEISQKLHRSYCAIQRRCGKLGYKERPLRESEQSRWSEEQVKLLKEMIIDGCNYLEMQDKIGKSDGNIRAKVYYLYKTGNLDKVRVILKGETK